MKVIDLLNKIAKGEEAPKKIQHDGSTYIVPEDITWLLEAHETLRFLNDEIEIIEEKPKKIEKISLCDLAITINDNSYYNNKIFMSKINEIIDYLLEKESDK